MTKRLQALILLAALLWQSLGMLGAFSVSQRAGEFEHVTVHALEANHHHHADHSLHMDVDENNAQHFHADAGSGGHGLLASTSTNLFDLSAMRLPDAPAPLWLSPTLEGPLRPPQHIA